MVQLFEPLFLYILHELSAFFTKDFKFPVQYTYIHLTGGIYFETDYI